MKLATSMIGALALLIFLGPSLALAKPPGNPAPVKQVDGEWYDAQGNPTYKIAKDGTVDFYTGWGFLQYGANCLRCHGPDGLGSSYAPDLVQMLKSLNYEQVVGTVAGGMRTLGAGQELVMPALGTDKNVMCNLDAIYIYLRARSTGALGRGRPEKVAPKPKAFDKTQNQCFGD